MIKSTIGTLLALVIVTTATPGPAHAAPEWTCLEPALEAELAGKLKFQDDFAALITETRPEFADIAAMNAATARQSFTMRFSRIAWLWRTDPGRFSYPDAFWSFAWNDKDLDGWLNADPDHRAMRDRLDNLKKQLREHPDAGALRAHVSENRTQSPFVDLTTAFGQAIGVQRDRVAACF